MKYIPKFQNPSGGIWRPKPKKDLEIRPDATFRAPAFFDPTRFETYQGPSLKAAEIIATPLTPKYRNDVKSRKEDVQKIPGLNSNTLSKFPTSVQNEYMKYRTSERPDYEEIKTFVNAAPTLVGPLPFIDAAIPKILQAIKLGGTNLMKNSLKQLESTSPKLLKYSQNANAEMLYPKHLSRPHINTILDWDNEFVKFSDDYVDRFIKKEQALEHENAKKFGDLWTYNLENKAKYTKDKEEIDSIKRLRDLNLYTGTKSEFNLAKDLRHSRPSIYDPTFLSKVKDLVYKNAQWSLIHDSPKPLMSASQHLVYPDPTDISFLKLRPEHKDFALKALGNRGAADKGTSITYGYVPKKPISTIRTLEVLTGDELHKFNKLNKLISLQPKVVRDYLTPDMVGKVTAHEGAHIGQELFNWGDLISTHSDKYEYHTNNRNTLYGRFLSKYMVEPSLPVNGNSTYQTWLSSGTEGHADLMKARYSKAKEIMQNTGKSMEEVVQYLKTDPDEITTEFAEDPLITKFFKPDVPLHIKKAIIKAAPAGAGIGLIPRNNK